MKKIVPLLLVVCLFRAPAVSAEPEDPDHSDQTACPECDQTEPVQLEDMFVTAFHGGAMTMTPTKTVIDVEKFNKSGSVDRVEDILMHLTGIDVMRGSLGADPQQMVMMRGFDDSRFTIAIDGRTITAPTAGADTYVDWSSLTTGDIEKIEVIRGAASAQYENSQGGVINIITKKGQIRETLVPRMTVSADYASYNTFTGRVTAGGGIGDLTYFLNYGYKVSDGYLRNNCYDGEDYSVRLAYIFAFDGILTLSVKGSDLKMGYALANDPGGIYADYDPDYPVVPEDADTIRRYRDMSFAGGDNYKLKRSVHKDVSFEQPFKQSSMKIQYYETMGEEDSYYYTLVKNSRYDPATDPPEAQYVFNQKYSGGNDRKERHYGGRFEYQMDFWDKNTLVVGYDQRHMEVKSTPDIWRIQAGYFEDTWQATPKLSLVLGLRYAHIREKTYAYSDEPGNPRSSRYRHDITTDVWLPKSTLTYMMSENTSTFVSVNKDYHVPGC
ncbi:MAG: TonB-dependent receptor [Desulfatitalea sp.]|nr:TonB-dependent receptor [Desulfatitalea sp.]NNK02627.1 TonB-dependent receptor [Desulfatitalea sp.]